MAKPSPAKVKMLASQAKKTAAANRAAKKANSENSRLAEFESETSHSGDETWLGIGLAAPVRRALVDAGFFHLSDLRKVSLASVKELHGMGPNAIRILTTEMRKQDLTFRN